MDLNRLAGEADGRTVCIRGWLPFLGIVAAVYAFVVPYVGPGVRTAARVEVADHVIPGGIIMAVSFLTLIVRRRRSFPLLLLAAGLIVVLAGLWMVFTHVPLVVQAARGEAPWSGSAYHTSAAVTVFGVGLLWVASYWSEAAQT